ncbi:MAG: polyribonucleotide nucleotidyltransferase, partial [Candidatus Eisenbacteria bacterium]|nr:polyribonucleotide nucleotidyltransferase [Candidatus Latescibacterota bacterium]MBD3302876.1 polyribonucleotide nucleotidyltransferase [Candidatus Eisenbacteria bacterium]
MGRIDVRVLDRSFTFEWGRLAEQAGGAVLVREGGTVLLVTACAAPEPREGIGFFPLTVDYRERFSAVGRFPGGYRKREGAATIHEVLTSRLIDRSIRPLFPSGFRAETQVLATVLSYEPDGDPAVLGILGAAAALELSDLPFDGPVAGIRIGRSPEGAPIAYPRAADVEAGAVDLVATVGRNGLVMVEGSAREASEEAMVEALSVAQEQAVPLVEAIGSLRREGRAKRPLPEERTDAE